MSLGFSDSPLWVPVAQQEFPVVSGTLPELQGSRESRNCERAIEEASGKVSGAQDI